VCVLSHKANINGNDTHTHSVSHKRRRKAEKEKPQHEIGKKRKVNNIMTWAKDIRILWCKKEIPSSLAATQNQIDWHRGVEQASERAMREKGKLGNGELFTHSLCERNEIEIIFI